MTKQAENCIDLLSGQPLPQIEQALKMLRSEVVQELMDYFEVTNRTDLADKLYLLS